MGEKKVREIDAERCVIFGERVRAMSVREKRLVEDQARKREQNRMRETGKREIAGKEKKEKE